MKQAFDPFAESRTAPPQRDGAAPGGSAWTPPEEGLLQQLVRIVRRRKWIVLSAVVLVPLAAFLYSHQQEKQYTATANLYFNDPTVGVVNAASSNVSVDPTRQAATDSALVSLPIVATYASRQTNGRISASEIESSVSVEGDTTSSDVVDINAVSASPQRAADIANAYASGYIDFRKNSDRAALQTNINQIQTGLDQLTPDEQASAQGRQLSDQVEELRTAQALRTGDAELVQPADAPTSPSSPKTKRNVAIGLFIGIVLGPAAALFEQFDQRIRTEEDLERVYGLPVLARIPRNRAIGRGQLTPEAAEPFRALRTNLRYLNFDQGLRSLLVASPLPADGKSTVARSLGTTMASMGDHVVLVEIDLHKRRDGQEDEIGLSGVLVGEDLEHALVEEEVPTPDGAHGRLLTVLPTGPMPPNPSELIGSERMHEVLRQLERDFELVILDAPALTSVSDGLSLVPSVSGILIVGGLSHTTEKAAVELRRQISLLHGNPIGIVANFIRAPRRGYGYGY